MYDLYSKKILVLGGSSMLGRASIKYLSQFTDSLYFPTHKELNLLKRDDISDYFSKLRPQVLVCAQGFNGNIQFNQKYPELIFEHTTEMAMNVLRSSQLHRVEKIVSFISSCAYPSTDILKEEEFWNGKPDDSVSAHGFSKRFIVEYAEQLAKKYSLQFNHIGMVVNTVYGPWDSFNPDKTKVIGSLISKFVKAQDTNTQSVNLLGTGENRREFIYCDDVGRYLIKVLQYDGQLPLINIGSGYDYSIRELANIIAKICEYKGHIDWSGDNGGQFQKLLDVSKMKNLFGDLQFITLSGGLSKTIDWYKKNI